MKCAPGSQGRRTTVTRALVAALVLTGCSAFGPGNVARDRFDYNQVIGRTNNEQMLLNLVRIRYREVPVFMAVSSVLTQYTYTGSVGLGGETGVAAGASTDLAAGSATLRYAERPTITYSPMTGPEFSEQLLRPIPVGILFSLAASGWPAEDLLRMGLERVNGVRNAPFRGEYGGSLQSASPEFEQVVKLIVNLSLAGALEVQVSSNEGPAQLILADGLGGEMDARHAEFRALLGLDPSVSAYRIVGHSVGRANDEITIRMRSLLALMGALGSHVQVPPSHLERRLVSAEGQPHIAAANEALIAIRSSDERPEDAIVAIEYLGSWFYLAESDLRSREAFGLVTYLYLMMASQPTARDPLITVTAG